MRKIIINSFIQNNFKNWRELIKAEADFAFSCLELFDVYYFLIIIK